MADGATAPRYHDRVASTREIALGLAGATVAELVSTLEDWSEEIRGLVARDLATESERELLRRIDRAVDDMTDELSRETGSAISTTLDRVVEVHERATLGLVEEAGVSGVAIEGPYDDVAPAAFAILAERPELTEALVSIRDDAVDAADRILREGVLRGASGDQIGRRLRSYVVGAERIPDEILEDRRSISSESVADAFGIEDASPEMVERIRDESGTISRRVSMIGREETINAHHEARIRSSIASPTVFAIEWSLSPRHPEFDVCDVLAGRTGWDPFGLGPGVWPPAAVPVRPHPGCLRILTDEIADPDDWGDDVSAEPGTLDEDPGELAAAEGLPPSEQEAIRSAVAAPSARAGVRILPEGVEP